MGRIFSYLVASVGALMFCLPNAQSQLGSMEHFPSSMTVEVGDTFTLTVSATNFNSILGFSGTIDFNPNLLEFVDVPVDGIEFPGLTPPDCGAAICSFIDNQLATGDLQLLWFDLGSGVTLTPPDTVMYDIRFKAIAEGTDTVDFNDDFQAFEYVDASLNTVAMTDVGSVITIGSGTTPPPNPSDPCANFTEFGVFVSADSIPTGAQTCLDISVCGFENIVGFSYTTQFDPTKLQFDSVTNITLQDLDLGNFGTTNVGNGFLNMFWIDPIGTNGVTLADETKIYEVCFTAIGAGGEQDSVHINSAQTLFKAQDSTQVELEVGSLSGVVTITGNSAAAVTVFASDETCEVGGDTCVDVRVKDFNDMLSLSYTMEWDETIIDFDTILDPNNFFGGAIAGSINSSPSLVDTGALTMSWLSPNFGTDSISLMDSTIIYQVCFNGVGAAGETSTVEFTSSLTTEGALQSDGLGGQNSIPLSTVDGSVTLFEPPSTDGFIFNLTDATACTGDTITLDFLAKGFIDINAMSFLLTWDTAQLDWIGIHDNILPPTFSLNDTPQNTDNGKVSVLWLDFPALDGETYNQDSVIFQLDFLVEGTSGTTTLEFTEDGLTPLNVADINSSSTDTLAYTIDNPIVTIDCSVPMVSLSSIVTNLDCYNDATGAIDVTVVNGTPTLDFDWTGPNNFTANTEDISGLAAGTYNLTFTDGTGMIIMDAYTITEPDSLILDFATTTSSCVAPDGTIDLTVTGGTTNYTFAWDNGLAAQEDHTDLAPGTYCVTVTDANDCSAEGCVTVEEATPPTLSGTTTTASCNGGTDGTINVTVQGGTGMITFNWDNSLPSQEDQSGLAAGEYCVTITDTRDCSANMCFTVAQDNAPELSEDITNVSCNGADDGEIDLTVTGGAGGEMFTWDNSLPSQEDQTGLAPGTYMVTVEDAIGCSVTGEYDITEPDILEITEMHTDVTCNGDSDGSINLDVTGGTTDYDYEWSGGLPATANQSGLDGGTYSVTVTDANLCEETLTITIDEPALLVLSGSVTNDSGSGTGAVDLTVEGGTTDYMFEWTGPGGFSETTEDITGLSPGTYDVTVTDANGCEETESFIVGGPGDPSISEAIITDAGCLGNDGSINITITGGAGGNTFLWDDNNGSDTEDIADLEPGTYNVTVTDQAGGEAFGGPYVVGQMNLITYTETHTDIACGGVDNGTITLDINGGSGTYDVEWSDGQFGEMRTNLAPGSYTPTITDSDGCELEGTAITIITLSDLSFTEEHTNTTCSDRDDGTITLDIQGGSGNYSVEWNGGITGEMISGLAPGSYTPTITDTDDGCQNIGAAITIFAADEINLDIVQQTDVVCFGEATGSITVITSGGAPNANIAVTWSPGGFGGLTYANLTAGDYTPTATDITNGCVVTGPTITIDQPNSQIRANEFISDVTCNGDADGSISIAATGGNGQVYTYTWDPPANINNDDDLIDVGPGSYSLTIADGLGCEATFGPFVISEPNVISAQAFIDEASSNNDDGKITLQVAGGNPDYDFEWSGPTSPLPNSNVINGLSSGEYDVTITDEEGCSFTATYLVEGNIGAAYVVNDVSCFGETDGSIIQSSISGGIDPYSYEWSGGSLVGNSFAMDLLDVGPGTYSLTITDFNGMVRIQNYTINEPPAIQVEVINVIHETGLGCNGLISVLASNGQGPYEYIWSNGGSTSTISDLCKGDYSVQVRDGNGCVVNSETITINPAGIGITNVTELNGACHNDSNGEVCLDYFGGCGPYTITLDGGTPQVDLDNSICFTGLNGGTHNITIIGNGGLIFNGSFEVTQYEEITASTDITDNTDPTGQNCTGFINLTVDGGVPPYTFQWSHGPTSEDVSELCDNLSPYSVTITDDEGCFIEVTGLEVGLGITTEATITDVCDIDSCDGEIFTDNTVGGVGPYTYLWSNNSTNPNLIGVCAGDYDLTITDSEGMESVFTYTVLMPDNPLAVTGSVSPADNGNNGAIDITISGGYGNYEVEWSNGLTSNDLAGLAPGTYVVTIFDNNECMVVESFTVPGGPTITMISTDAECFGGTGCLEANVMGGGLPPFTYNWSNGDSGNRICDLQPGEYSVTITDSNGLVFSQNGIVQAPSQILVEISAIDDTSIEAIPSGGTPGIDGYTYAWQPLGQDTRTISDLSPGSYTVLVTDANGCVATESYEVDLDGECTDVRSIITPNSDGENDAFIIACAYRILDNELSIFNRWGELVFQRAGYNNDWEGTGQSNEMLPAGGYFYVFEFTDPSTGNIEQLKGHITILR